VGCVAEPMEKVEGHSTDQYSHPNRHHCRHARGGDVSSRHYDHYDYVQKRRAAMAKWATYLDLVIAGTVDQLGAREGNVVSIGTALGAQS
jgi:hypothetical protein